MKNIKEDDRTLGVRILGTGIIECQYYVPFVESLSIEELFSVIQHEIEHVVRCHCVRSDKRHPLLFNIAADMCVNGPKDSPRIGWEDANTKQKIIPHIDTIPLIPKDWEQDETVEFYYDKLISDELHSQPGNGTENGNYKFIDNHDFWQQSELSIDEVRQIVKGITDEATEKAQGNIPSHLVTWLEQLKKPVVKWRELLKQYLGKHIGSKRYTYSRSNRRHNFFGIPGVSRRAAATVNVIVDTSGSISNEVLSQFFAEIDMISNRASVKILQWDYDFQGFNTYRRGDWKQFQINGRGGTDMALPIEWLIENNLVADCQIMLTDGHCNYANKKPFPMITVISDHNGSEPNWGHIVRLQID